MKTRALASTTLTLTGSTSVSGHFTHCWVSLVAVTIYSILTCTRIPCRAHTTKTGLSRCCLYTTRRLQQTAVSCKRSNCNQMENSQKQIRESRSSEVLSKDRTQRVAPFDRKPLHASFFIDFLWIIMKTTRNHSIATNWRKNSMMGAVPGTSRRVAVWLVVLQILGVNGLM